MTNERLKQVLAMKHIHNTWDFVGNYNVFISRYAATTGLGAKYGRWAVIRPGYKTDSNSGFNEDGCKTFVIRGREDVQKQLTAAMDWCTNRYGIDEWIKSPFGDWMSKKVYDEKVKEL